MNKIKFAAIVSYFGIIGIIFSKAINSEEKNEFIDLHFRQAFLISIIILSLNFFNYGLDNSIFRTIIWSISIFLKCIGIYYAFNNQQKNIPILGEYAQKWFKNL